MDELNAQETSNEQKLFKHIHEDLQKQITLAGHTMSDDVVGQIQITIRSEIPLGSGLGSSAAWGASISSALLHSFCFLACGSPFGDKAKEKELVWAYTNFLEKLYHGRPSGCDAAVSIHGGCLFYQRVEPPGLTTVKPLPRCKIDSQGMIVVNTNAKKNTKALVSKVKAFKESNPEEFTELMNTLGDVTSEVVECLQEQAVDRFAFLDYVSMSQQYLQDIGVSSPEIDEVVEIMMLREVHGKLTGAGGGGCVIGFPKDPKSLDHDELKRELDEKGYTLLEGVLKGDEGYKCILNQ